MATQMKCPNCLSELKPEKIGSTVYWHCQECGALWFDNKESDFLTLDEAETLAKADLQVSFSNLSYKCPRDGKELKFDQYYYRCFSCGGVLSSANGLVQEKTDKAQSYLQEIKKPLTFNQLRYVTILGGVAIFLGLNFFMLKQLNQKMPIASQASEVKANLRVQSVGESQLAVYFGTTEPYLTTAYFKDATGREWTTKINTEPSVNHFLIIKKPKTRTSLKVKLTSVGQEESFTDEIILPL